MAIYEQNGRVVHFTFEGRSAMAEIAQTFTRALAELPPGGSFRLLMDLTKSVSLAQRTSSDIEGLSRFINSSGHGFDRSALVANRDLYYGLMRVAAAIGEAEGFEVQVFRDKNDALAWLQSNS